LIFKVVGAFHLPNGTESL